MPRKARYFAPGCCYHVMARCHPSTMLFHDGQDFSYFLVLLATYLDRANFRCYAWACMSNHYHLVLRSSEKHLAFVMKPLNMRYAQYHARKHQRRGILFCDRYKSIATQDQGYLEEMIRYVHLNPIRAGVCNGLSDLENYPWCGHSALMGTYPRTFQDTRTVLRRFGQSGEDAREWYVFFLREGLEEKEESSIIRAIRRSNRAIQRKHEPAIWVIGDPDFVQRAFKEDQAQRFRISCFEREGWNMEDLASKVAEKFKISAQDLKRRTRANTAAQAKKAFAYIAYHKFDRPVIGIADYFGITSSAVSAMLVQGEEIVRRKGIRI